MLAALCREIGCPLTPEPVEIREPAGREVVVDLAACAICHSDIAFIDGAWATPLPAVFGHEAAGTVVACGAEATGVAPGDRVVVTLIRACGACAGCTAGHPVLCSDAGAAEAPIRTADGPVAQGMHTGAFCDRVLVDRSQVVALPDAMPLDHAALLGCGALTGHGAVTNTAQVPAGASVAVVGAGGVGMQVVRAAALAGADPIIAIDPVETKRAEALRQGATRAIDPRADDTAVAMGSRADFVFVAVGVAALMEQALGLVAPGGALVVVGMPPEGSLVRFDPSGLAARSQRILGSKMGDADPVRDIPRLVDHYLAGRLDLEAMIAQRRPFSEINSALDDARRGDGLRQVVLFDR